MYNQLKIAISLLFVFVLNTSHGQYNSMFGDSYTEWNYMTLYCDATFTYTFQQSDDTIIGAIQYKVIDDFGLLRESENNDKIWYRNIDSEVEHLIMDLDLEVGDIFEIDSEEYQVDMVYVENGNKIIQFDFIPPNCGFEMPLKFIEGHGPNYSFRYIFSGDTQHLGLLRCHTRDSITDKFYVETFGEECITNETSTKEIKEKDIIVYPNPFVEQFHIEFEESKERSIKLFDLLGRHVYFKNSSDIEIDINTDVLIEGIYMLQIQEGLHIMSMMLVKQSG